MTPPNNKPPRGVAAMLLAKTATFGQALDEAEKDPNRVKIQDQPPITMPGQLGAFRLEAKRWQDRIVALERELREAKEQGGALELDLDSLVVVEGRRRKLSPTAYAELRENLRQHALITPITVKPLGDGRYEIVSGHNRVEIYRELGRKTIKAWPAETDNDKTDELAFYANLMHTDLPAYEKYLGLCLIQQNNPHLNTHEALAARTGMARSTVTELMAFANLPADVHAALEKKPELVKASSVAKLVQAVGEGRAAQVSEAVAAALQSDNGIEQKELLRMVEKPAAAAAKAPQAQQRDFKAGRNRYCSMVAAKKVLRLEFSSEDERALAEEQIAKLMETLAEARRNG